MTRKGMNVVLFLLLVSLVFPSLVFADGSSGSGQGQTFQNNKVMLANNGHAMYKVFVRQNADAIERKSAVDLVQTLQQVTGAPFELAEGESPPKGHVIIVGRNAATEALAPELAGDTLGEDGFVIRNADRYLVIAGSHSRGTMYGVNTFLEKYVGVKWFSPDYTYVPNLPKLQVKVGSDVQVPRFEYREMYVSDGNNEQYRAHNLLNGKYRDRYRQVPQSEPGLDSWSKYWPEGVHNFYSIVPDAQYHSGRQLLAMDENVRQIAATNLTNTINQRVSEGKDPSYGFSQMDDIWEPDAASQAFADAHGGSLAAPILDLVNDVARRVKASIPDARISTLAYLFSYQAPTNMRAEDNVVITAAPIFKDHGRPFDSPENQFYEENTRQWANISSNMMVWDYLTDFNGGGYLMPYPNLKAIGENIKYLAQFPAVKGYFGQQMQNTNAPGETGFAYLRTWVAAKLLWNPDLDYHQLIDEFVHGYYGKAAPYISEYLDLLQNSFDQSDSTLSTSTPMTSSYLSFDLMRRADQLFEQAVDAAADDPVMLDHVQKARVEVDYTILMRGASYMKEAKDRNIAWNYDFENRFNRFKANTADVIDYKSNTPIQLLYDTIGLNRTVPDVPSFVQDLPASDWMDYQDDSLRLYTPVGTKLVQDAKASDNVAARVTGNANAWAIQLPNLTLPKEGKWKLFAHVRIDPGTGVAGNKAFDYGIYPPTQNTAWADYADFADGEYHYVEFPWIYQYDPSIENNYLWIAPPNSSVVQNLYVDRIIAVRQS